jgi:hypothetical protein
MATPRKVKQKPITEMNADALAHATAELDTEFVSDSFNAPNTAASARWRQAKRKRGRPRRGKGAKKISVSLEQGLLTRATKLAKKLGVPRAQLISLGLEAVLAVESGK